MSCSPLARVMAAALGLALCLAGPGSALAHGVAHHRAGHEREHHEQRLALGGSWDAGRPTPAVAPAGGSGDHAHPELGGAVKVRTESPLLDATVPRASLTVEFVLVAHGALVVPIVRPRADPAHAPPLQPRAPPVA